MAVIVILRAMAGTTIRWLNSGLSSADYLRLVRENLVVMMVCLRNRSGNRSILGGVVVNRSG